ncbi:hypothetical protein HID58_031699 [Brassica napus]|uniref:Uncharacterized protein n=1 Tax=Brassica napus TaxID=3708 RepID=A0ABQ8BVF8_BRANA|nr:hypothetical protein HID58_031699 [Brassica napus]
MVENFGDGELRETFQFHLQYCKSFKHLPRHHHMDTAQNCARSGDLDNQIRRSKMAISPSKPQTSSRSFTRALALA